MTLKPELLPLVLRLVHRIEIEFLPNEEERYFASIDVSGEVCCETDTERIVKDSRFPDVKIYHTSHGVMFEAPLTEIVQIGDTLEHENKRYIRCWLLKRNGKEEPRPKWTRLHAG